MNLSRALSNLVAITIIISVVACIGVYMYASLVQHYHIARPRQKSMPKIDIVCYDIEVFNETSYLCFFKNTFKEPARVSLILENGTKIEISVDDLKSLVLESKPIVALVGDKVIEIEMRKPR